ncbi:transcriptional regulator [Streptomyces sp. NPDC050085]|uniref:transcriptional regulator n=1 Tax=Streptomyces sp. NPDC050085 TaxID=3365600 RepID=UPI0037B0A286
MERTPHITTGQLPARSRTLNVIRPDAYADSVALMRAAGQLSALPGIEAASLVMATGTNLRILAEARLLTPEGEAARPADLLIALRGSEDAVERAVAAVHGLLEQPAQVAAPGAEFGEPAPRALTEADPATGLALISTPGPYAAAEALKALRHGLHAFVFSDNVPLDQEIRLKQEAHRLGLLAMGPDCGTALIDGVPLGFANALRTGRIGLIGASGTGLQQVSCLLDAAGEGVRQMIGTGGRDLSAEVGGRTTLDAFELLDADPGCALILLVSKPPDPRVAARVLARAERAGKPVVAAFLGAERQVRGAQVSVVGDLRGAADEAVRALGGTPPPAWTPPTVARTPGGHLRALYAGGTFAYETRHLLPDAVGAIGPYVPGRAVTFPAEHVVLDLGDDAYTAGRPHPMIDPTVRAAHLRAALTDPGTGAVVLDVVLGHGAGPDPVAPLAAEIDQVPARQRPPVIGFVVGTDRDPQDATAQRALLEDAGVLLAPTSTDAARWAAGLVSGAPQHAGGAHLLTSTARRS